MSTTDKVREGSDDIAEGLKQKTDNFKHAPEDNVDNQKMKEGKEKITKALEEPITKGVSEMIDKKIEEKKGEKKNQGK